MAKSRVVGDPKLNKLPVLPNVKLAVYCESRPIMAVPAFCTSAMEFSDWSQGGGLMVFPCASLQGLEAPGKPFASR